MSPLYELIGAIAGCCTTFAFLPQVLQTWRSRSTRDISLAMYSVLCSGLVLWTAYGFMIGSASIVAANVLTLLLALSILTMKLVWERRGSLPAPEAPAPAN